MQYYPGLLKGWSRNSGSLWDSSFAPDEKCKAKRLGVHGLEAIL
jgi:hypothetical protein